MKVLIIAVVVVVVLVALTAALSVRVVKQYQKGVLFRLGRALGPREPGLRLIIPFADVLHRVSLRIVTMPIQSQGIITSDNVSIDVSAVAYYRVADPVRSVIAIEDVEVAINQNIREILDVQTEEWGIKVTTVELKDIQLPDSMKRAK